MSEGEDRPEGLSGAGEDTRTADTAADARSQATRQGGDSWKRRAALVGAGFGAALLLRRFLSGDGDSGDQSSAGSDSGGDEPPAQAAQADEGGGSGLGRKLGMVVATAAVGVLVRALRNRGSGDEGSSSSSSSAGRGSSGGSGGGGSGIGRKIGMVVGMAIATTVARRLVRRMFGGGSSSR